MSTREDGRLVFREPANVADFMTFDKLVRRARRIRREAVQSKRDVECWNRLHPNEPPMSTDWEDSVIAWCDGKGPNPTIPSSPTPDPEDR